MAYEPVGAILITGSSGTLPAHQAGDLIVVTAVRWSTDTVPTVPSGWTSVVTSTATFSRVVAWRLAAASGTASGTWTNAQALYVAVHHGPTSLGAVATKASASSTAGPPALTLTQPGWGRVAVMGSGGGVLPATPAGMVSRFQQTGVGVYDRYADTDGPASTWTAQTGTWEICTAYELIAATDRRTATLATTSWNVCVRKTATMATTSWWVRLQRKIATLATTSFAVRVRKTATLVTTGWQVTTHANWQANSRTAAYRKALLAPQRTTSARVELVDYAGNPATYTVDGEPLSTDHLHASIEYSGEVAESYQASFSTTDPAWVPKDHTHPLDPRSQYALRLWWGLEVEGATVEIPIGTVVPADVDIDRTGTLSITWTGRDMLSIPKASGYGGQVIDLGGMRVDKALLRLFEILAPALTVRCAATDIVLPDVFEVGAKDSPADDWAAIAAVAGWIVRTDRLGAIVCGPPPDPSVTVREVQEGPDCPASRFQRNISSVTYNRVVVASSHPDVDPPVWGYDEDKDPGSPTWIGLGVIRELSVDSDVPTTTQACINMARLELGKFLRPTEGVTVTIPQDPTLNYRDPIALGSPAAGIGGEYRVSKLALTLPIGGDTGGPMSVTMMRRAMQ